MPINFDEISTAEASGGGVAKVGRYQATIESAVMKQGKDSSKPLYLAVTYNLVDSEGKKAGKFWDNITEPNADITKFKLKRFIEACEIKGLTNFELKDLAKIVPGKVIYLDLTADKNDPAKTILDVFSGLIYYSQKDIEETAPANPSDIEDPLDFETAGINGSDATDATPSNNY